MKKLVILNQGNVFLTSLVSFVVLFSFKIFVSESHLRLYISKDVAISLYFARLSLICVCSLLSLYLISTLIESLPVTLPDASTFVLTSSLIKTESFVSFDLSEL